MSSYEMVMKILKAEKKKYDAEMELSISSDKEIRKLAKMKNFSLYSDEEFDPAVELDNYNYKESYNEGGFDPEWN